MPAKPDKLDVSVVVPTRNRSGLLPEFFRGLTGQSLASSRWELVLVDDGSSDGSSARARELISEAKIQGRVISQKHRGRSAARNLGIKAVEGENILILTDDIIAAPGLLQAHLEFRRLYPRSASVGYVTWWPQMEITSFMRHLEEGVLLSFQALRHRQELDYRHAYSSNISLPAEAALAVPFDENFTRYGFEDIEWGYRLQCSGIGFHFNREALGYHLHPLDSRQYRVKMEEAGYSLAMMYSKHPEIRRMEIERATLSWRLNLSLKASWRQALLRSSVLRRLGVKIDKRRCWKSLLDRSFIKGLMRGKKEFIS